MNSRYLIYSRVQENVSTCLSEGLACYENVTVDKSNCLTPCFGLFADISHLESLQTSVGLGGMYEYEEYKRGWKEDIEYHQQIISMLSIAIYLYFLSSRVQANIKASLGEDIL